MTQSTEMGSRKRDGDEESERRLSAGDVSESNESSGSGESPDERKERVLHTRVPAVLERELKRLAETMRVPVSNLVRAVLEDAVAMADEATENVESHLKSFAENLGHGREKLKKRVARDPLEGVFAFQPVKVAQPTACTKCGQELKRGTNANLGLREESRPGAPRVFVCDACLPTDL